MKAISRSRRAMLLGAGALAATAAACAIPGWSGEGAGIPLAQRKAAVTEFWGGPNSAQHKAQVDAWNAKYPNLPVRFTSVAAVAAGVDSLREFSAAVAAGTAPAVIDLDRFQVAGYANWRLLRPLDDFVKQAHLNLADFSTAALGEATGLDKKLYGLPSSVDVRLLYWNKQAFADAGLDPEKPPATWDQLQAAATQLTHRSGDGTLDRLGFHTEHGQATLHLFAWQNGGSFLSPDGKKVTLAQPANQQALEWMVELMRQLVEPAESKRLIDAWDRSASQPPFLTGQLAMQYQINNWAGEMIARQRSDMAFGVAPPPVRRAGDPPSSWSGGYSYVVSRSPRNPDVAWELVKWLVGEEAWNIAYESETARARAAGGTYLPSMSGQVAVDKKMSARYKTGIAALDSVTDVALNLMQHTRFREPCIAAADLWQGITQAERAAVLRLQSAKDALEEQNTIAQRALDQAWVFAPK